ncbi:hypothetical protein H4R33_004775 [Dimargaris cristalligena]|uniref:Corrinoid adenosyltransferase MMAB n=1 Tax=Dimargaris cristalligena TaxID=215637 RepID=A0A4P9ZWK0_9FUNG|nr:hypothetical protein H4R33_004775 [Dimargaris cristalligena]RKP37341.1 Adenosylcobalamin biosynthesis, ATP:cob(I)alamin adenosyltransferase-like protein [Dimargaris cristalligena]|eukprot:RKP37341.1 Adenosylcobalamin biosynthesis, ATP:cob(I)alamin adenosyltransferase-like protein [Dimargaris cristalligena]
MSDTNIPKSKLYTRTGDKGVSSLYTGSRVSKAHIIFEALGAVDELNSAIGIAHLYCQTANNGLAEHLEEIQCRLFEIGSCVATPPDSASEEKAAATRFDGAWVDCLEKEIDVLDSQLPPLRNFILPSGGSSGVFLHQCRSICRRAERNLVTLSETSHADTYVLRYVNRLSDYFFAAARFAAQHDKHPETIFRSGKKVAQE